MNWFEMESSPLSIRTWMCYIPFDLMFENFSPIPLKNVLHSTTKWNASQHKKDLTRICSPWLMQ